MVTRTRQKSVAEVASERYTAHAFRLVKEAGYFTECETEREFAYSLMTAMDQLEGDPVFVSLMDRVGKLEGFYLRQVAAERTEQRARRKR